MLSTYALLRSVLFVQPAWLFATLTLYLERRCEGAKDPHGSFARLHAAPGMLLFLYRTTVLSPAYTLRQINRYHQLLVALYLL
jgi:hypothetical protein